MQIRLCSGAWSLKLGSRTCGEAVWFGTGSAGLAEGGNTGPGPTARVTVYRPVIFFSVADRITCNRPNTWSLVAAPLLKPLIFQPLI